MPSPPDEYVLAIDLGTSGPKVAVVAESGEILGSAFRPVESIALPGGGVEHDPEAVWRAVCEASRDAIGQSGASADSIAAIICDSHFFSIVSLDKAGQPTMNLMVWLDRRGASENLKRVGNHREDSLWRMFQWWRLHGIPPMPSGVDNISKLRWIRLASPEVYDRTAMFLEPVDYLNYRMTGRQAANACTIFAMQVTDTRKADDLRYSDTLLRYAEFDREKLPELVEVDEIVGTVTPEAAAALGVSTRTRVIGGINDTQAGAMGCGAFQGNHAAIGLGSSGALVTHTSVRKTDVFTGLFSMPSPVKGEYLVTGEGGVAGRTLEHFLHGLIYADDHFGTARPDDPYARLEEVAAASPPGSNGVLFLPWLNGSMVPANDTDMRGGFLNVSLETRRVDIARAVIEGISMQYRFLGQAARKFTGRDFSHFVLYGGGALSPTCSQTIADVMQVPVHRMAQPRMTNCLGLGLLGHVRLGRISLDEMAARIPIDKVYEPNAGLRGLYEDKGATLKMAFKQNRRVFRRMNRSSTDPD